jgi:hypothetical protein
MIVPMDGTDNQTYALHKLTREYYSLNRRPYRIAKMAIIPERKTLQESFLVVRIRLFYIMLNIIRPGHDGFARRQFTIKKYTPAKTRLALAYLSL